MFQPFKSLLVASLLLGVALTSTVAAEREDVRKAINLVSSVKMPFPESLSRNRAKTEHDLKRAAKELGAEVKTSDFVLPDGQVPDLGSMTGQAAVAFTMKPGEISGPINSGGNGVVLTVLENQQPTDADFAAKRDQIRDSLLQTKQQELFGLFVSNIRDQMEKSGKIKINQEEMKALTHAGAEQGM